MAILLLLDREDRSIERLCFILFGLPAFILAILLALFFSELGGFRPFFISILGSILLSILGFGPILLLILTFIGLLFSIIFAKLILFIVLFFTLLQLFRQFVVFIQYVR